MRLFALSGRNDDMEYAIAIFVGLWIAAAGILAYSRISKDFADISKEDVIGEEGTKE